MMDIPYGWISARQIGQPVPILTILLRRLAQKRVRADLDLIVNEFKQIRFIGLIGLLIMNATNN